MALPPNLWIRSVNAACEPTMVGFQPVLRASPIAPMVSRMIVPSTKKSQFEALSLAICEEKSVAPRL